MNLRHPLSPAGLYSTILLSMSRFLLSVALFFEMTTWTGVALGVNNNVFACVKKSNGAVRIVDPSSKCKNSESAIQWNITGPQGPTGPLGSTGPQGLGTLLLVDASGHTIGTYDAGQSAIILVGNVRVEIGADGSGFQPSSIDFWHDSPDCSGPRYLPDPDPALFTFGETTDSKTAFYAQLGSPTPVEIVSGSVERVTKGSDASEPGTCEGSYTGPAPFTPPQMLDLTTFTPPFHLQ